MSTRLVRSEDWEALEAERDALRARVAALEKWADYLKMLSADLEDRVAALEAALRDDVWHDHRHTDTHPCRMCAILDALPPREIE